MPSVFTDALLASPLPVIMEVKRKDGNDVDLMGDRTIPEVVADYTAAGAPCIRSSPAAGSAATSRCW